MDPLWKAYLVDPRLFVLVTHKPEELLCSGFSEIQLVAFLPVLARKALRPCNAAAFSVNEKCNSSVILQLISGIQRASDIGNIMAVDYKNLQSDLQKDLKIKKKNISLHAKLEQVSAGCGTRFEQGDNCEERLRILLSELLYLSLWVKEKRQMPTFRNFELLDNCAFWVDVSLYLSVAMLELRTFLDARTIAEVLLHYRHGPVIMQRVFANFPHWLEEVCVYLITNGEKQDEDAFQGRQRADALLLLADMQPELSGSIRDICLSECKMPSLLLKMWSRSESIEDLCTFLLNVLLGRSDDKKKSVRQWMVQHFAISQRQPRAQSSVQLVKQRLINTVKQLLAESQHGSMLPEDRVPPACVLIKCLCVLRLTTSIRFTDTESELWLSLLCTKLSICAAGVELILVALAVLAAAGNVFGGTNSADSDEKLRAWLSWLLEVEPEFARLGVDGCCGYEEMLLLMTIHLHSNHYHLLSSLAQAVLGWKVQIRANNVTRLRTVFLEVFAEDVVAERAARVPVTSNLSAITSGYLPAHCVQHLLKSRVFSKHQIDIKDWIVRQLQHCKRPVHNVVPSLIEAYVHTCLTMNTGGLSIAPIEESNLIAMFEADPLDEEKFVLHILLMYYVLFYEETWLSQIRTAAANNMRLPSYSSKLSDCIPIRFLMRHVKGHLRDFAVIYPSLLRMVTSQYPYLFTVNEPLSCAAQKVHAPDVVTWPLLGLELTVVQLKDALCGCIGSTQCVTKALILLKKLVHAPAKQQVIYLETLAECLPHLLDASIPQQILAGAVQLWEHLENILPRKLYRYTVSALVRAPSVGIALSKRLLSHEDLCLDPLIVLKCDERVFRCPLMLEIVLRMLSSYMMASRVDRKRQMVAQPGQAKLMPGTTSNVQQVDAERDELYNALIGAQESAAVQLVLEICLETPDDRRNMSQLSSLREVQCIVCSHLHQMFISDPMLIKLVHFQGYPHELVPLTVRGVPSMHVCFTFIPELLQFADCSKQLFGVHLLSHLCEQYTIPKALSCARLAINVLNTLITILPPEHVVNLFLVATMDCVRMCNVFPPLCDEVVGLLVHVGRIATSRLAATAGLSLLNVDGYADSEHLNLLTAYSGQKEAVLLKNLQHVFKHQLLLSAVTFPL